ncbi:MAG: biotin transporter BioY [Natronincolaceae bacterium]|jgi:biotin transport system substrate-specific component|nr:biotin transporter BioY [Bacillota bacterium]NLK90622.1 biotin transporter BioY [Clostridiales bacterium]
MNIKEMTKLSLCTALICVSSYIVIPLPFTPIMITGQTMAVNLIALILSPVHSAICIMAFILLGASGLPVFAGGSSGLGVLFGQTGGFILGFLFAAVAISFLKGKKASLSRYLLVTIFLGIPIIHLLGAAYMGYILNITYIKALQLGVIPFLAGDLIKAVLACIIAVRLNNYLIS